jgi:hypothetical protein
MLYLAEGDPIADFHTAGIRDREANDRNLPAVRKVTILFSNPL